MLIIDVYNKAEWGVGGDEVGVGRKSMLLFPLCFIYDLLTDYFYGRAVD